MGNLIKILIICLILIISVNSSFFVPKFTKKLVLPNRNKFNENDYYAKRIKLNSEKVIQIINKNNHAKNN